MVGAGRVIFMSNDMIDLIMAVLININAFGTHSTRFDGVYISCLRCQCY